MCLQKDPKDRATAQELLNHPWLAKSDKNNESGKALTMVSKNLTQFSLASNFQKTVISMLAGLKVQAEELSSLRDAFIIIDSNQDGTLDLEELRVGLKHLCLFEIMQDPDEGVEDCYQKIMEMCDLDGDGKIDYLEFIQAAINHKALLNRQNIQIIFDMFD